MSQPIMQMSPRAIEKARLMNQLYNLQGDLKFAKKRLRPKAVIDSIESRIAAVNEKIAVLDRENGI